MSHSVYAAAKPSQALPATEEQPATYRVRRGDTLLAIAKHLNLNTAHYYQTAAAIFHKNPQAFIDYNLSKLVVDKTLQLPDTTEVSAVSLAEAKRIVRSGRVKSSVNKGSISQDNINPIKPSRGESANTNKPTQAERHSLLAKTLLDDIKAIESKRSQLQHQLPTAITQKQARMAYLTGVQGLIQQLEENFAQYSQQETDYQHRLLELQAQKQKLQAIQQASRQAHHKLRATVKKARLLQPKHMSWNQPNAKPSRTSSAKSNGKPDGANSFFRRIAQLKRQQQPLSPLLEQTEALYCAVDQQAADATLQKFFDIAAPGTDWPDETLGNNPHKATLHASSMDILLTTLHRTIERFPALSQLSERVVLQWDYCAITGNGVNGGDGEGFYDLTLNREALQTNKAAPKAPLRWRGFELWGFSTGPAKDASRYIPKLLEVREPYHAYELFLHRVHRQHCFPHPASGKVYNERTEERVFSRSIYPGTEQHSDTPYPYHWQPICELPQVNHQNRMVWSAQMLKRSQARLKQTENRITALDKKMVRLEQEHSEQLQVFQQQNKQIEQQIDAAKVAEVLRKDQLTTQYTAIAKLDGMLTVKKQALYPTLMQAQAIAAAEQRALEQGVTEEAIINAVMAMHMHDLAVRGAYGTQAHVAGTTGSVNYAGVQGGAVDSELEGSAHGRESQASAPLSQRSVPPARAMPVLSGVEGQESGHNITSTASSLEESSKNQLPSVSPKHRFTKRSIQKEGVLPAKSGGCWSASPFSKGGTRGILGLATPSLKKEKQEGFKTFITKLSNTPKVNFTQPKKAKSKPKAAKATKTKEKKLGITATALYTIPASGDKPFGKLSASWKPKTNWFVRGAVKYLKDEDFTYSWGVGYSDWRPGTTSVQLNNWGPVKSGEGLDIDDAVFSISHKVDSEWLRDQKLSLSLGMSKPISGDAAFNATFQWNPIKNWYFRTTASQKLDGGPTKWSYGFGYFDWRPETWRVEYSNYETNRYPFDNFREGAITINRAWEF